MQPEAKPEEAAATAAAAESKPEEEEDNTKSYEEYLAERAQAALALNIGKLEARKVEGDSELVGAALTKPEEEEFYTAASKVSYAQSLRFSRRDAHFLLPRRALNQEKTKAEKAKAPKKEKVFIEVEGRFPPPSTGERRGGRGGAARGGDRGRGAPRNTGDRPARGGAARGGRGAGPRAAAPVAVNDESAFPALGA
jgi:plasminogen activator inhibitor 1 RNA-binding protein